MAIQAESSRIHRIFVTVSNLFRDCFEEHHELVEKNIILHESYFSTFDEIAQGEGGGVL